MAKNESVVTLYLGKQECGPPTAQIDGPVIPAMGKPHRPFRRMSVTTFSIFGHDGSNRRNEAPYWPRTVRSMCFDTEWNTFDPMTVPAARFASGSAFAGA